jgi:hypothetical protein
MAKAEQTSADRDVTGSASSAVRSGESGSVPEQAKEKVQEGVEVVQEKAEEWKGTAGERVRQEVDARSTEAGTQLQGTAAAMRRTTEQLRQEGNEAPARAMDFVAERAERLGSYLAGANADQVLRDVEGFARRQPWLVAIGGATAGFFAARFLKASSGARYQAGSAATGSRQGWQPEASPAARSSIGSGAIPATTVQETGEQPVLTAPRGSSNG